MQVLMNKFSYAKEIYKIVIIRWSIGMAVLFDWRWTETGDDMAVVLPDPPGDAGRMVIYSHRRWRSSDLSAIPWLGLQRARYSSLTLLTISQPCPLMWLGCF